MKHFFNRTWQHSTTGQKCGRWSSIAKKCYTLPVTRQKKRVVDAVYTLHNEELRPVQHKPVPCIEIQTDMKWNVQIDNMVSKANRSLGFLRRNLCRCPTQIKAMAYNTLSGHTWNMPHLFGTPTSKKISSASKWYRDRQPALFVGSTAGNQALLLAYTSNSSGRHFREEEKHRGLPLFQKVLNNTIAVKLPSYVKVPTRSGRRQQPFSLVSARTDAFKFSFFPRCVFLWNNLPADLRHTHRSWCLQRCPMEDI